MTAWDGAERRTQEYLDIAAIEERLINIGEQVARVLLLLEGNGKPGLVIDNDRNTQFRKGISKALWFIITPLYAGMIAMLINSILKLR